MKRVLFLAVLLMFMGTTACALTCVGKVDSVAYYSADDFLLMVKLASKLNDADGEAFCNVAVAMINEGRATWMLGVRLGRVEINGLVAVGFLSNGRQVFMPVRELSCS